MAKSIKLEISNLEKLHSVNPRLISYNVEMTEVTGGTFWKGYTEAQIDGTEAVPAPDFSKGMGAMHQWYEPIDTKNPRLIKLAKALGSCWVRVSGTWATKTYYDFADEYPAGTAPKGYDSVLKKQQWLDLLDFVKAVDGKLLISVANCEGLHSTEEPWNPSQAEQIFALSKEYGVPVDAVEFTNEPTMLEVSGFPKGYKPAHYGRDHDIFYRWLRENYPDCLAVGPCTCDAEATNFGGDKSSGGGIADVMGSCTTHQLMAGCTELMDVFSYHCYNGISERMAAMMPNMYTGPEGAMSEDYLGMAGHSARCFKPYRDQYAPGGELWVTESGDAGAGGHTWASTYLEVPRTLNEIGDFASETSGVIFHNTLASSDYGWLKHGTFVPRPSYFAVLLWKALMGNTVYDSKIARHEGAHVFCHDRADGKEGNAWLVINTSWTEPTSVELPKEAQMYVLAGKDGMRSRTMTLNGEELALGEEDALPELKGIVASGTVEVAPGSCAFFVL